MKKRILISMLLVLALIIAAGIYKFNYLASKEGYDVDGNKMEQPASEKANTKAIDYSGNYVTSDYSKRNQGYDWIGVSVLQLSDSTISIRIRSRIDKKKPSCTFDAKAIKVSENVYKSVLFETEKTAVLYTFKDNILNISPEKKEDLVLQYPCSGGGTLAGNYTKITEELDQSQIDKSIFNKTLNGQNMGYTVTSFAVNGHDELQIQPYGFENNKLIKQPLEAHIENAEIGDLDQDGFPEIIIYEAPSKENRSYNVIGYSSNKGKSFSSIFFPNVSDNPKLKSGYLGNDTFSIVKEMLIQRYKIHQWKGDTPYETGKTQEIQYKLIPGENAKKFVIYKLKEF